MHQISPTAILVSKHFPVGETPGPPLLRGPVRGGEGVGGRGRGGDGKGRGCRGPGKWSAPGPVLALGGPVSQQLQYLYNANTRQKTGLKLLGCNSWITYTNSTKQNYQSSLDDTWLLVFCCCWRFVPRSVL